jgi:hypothetical protein
MVDESDVFRCVWDRVCKDHLCASAIRSLRKRQIDLKSVVEPLCWVVFLGEQRDWSVERLASDGLTGHDWRSLKRLPARLDKFVTESARLESAAGRPLNSLRSKRGRLDKETKQIHPSAVLAPDLLTQPFSETLEARSRFLQSVIPNAQRQLQRSREDREALVHDSLDQLAKTGLTYGQIGSLLNATAEALGIEKYYSPSAVKMRLFRRSKPSL